MFAQILFAAQLRMGEHAIRSRAQPEEDARTSGRGAPSLGICQDLV